MQRKRVVPPTSCSGHLFWPVFWEVIVLPVFGAGLRVSVIRNVVICRITLLSFREKTLSGSSQIRPWLGLEELTSVSQRILRPRSERVPSSHYHRHDFFINKGNLNIPEAFHIGRMFHEQNTEKTITITPNTALDVVFRSSLCNFLDISGSQ